MATYECHTFLIVAVVASRYRRKDRKEICEHNKKMILERSAAESASRLRQAQHYRNFFCID